ncbi:MAG TPA: hypothetical protein VNZ57_02335 [Longimicrobiales bacterium]|nr:hypothetical protein [Longimicrobiales bacterium]
MKRSWLMVLTAGLVLAACEPAPEQQPATEPAAEPVPPPTQTQPQQQPMPGMPPSPTDTGITGTDTLSVPRNGTTNGM